MISWRVSAGAMMRRVSFLGREIGGEISREQHLPHGDEWRDESSEMIGSGELGFRFCGVGCSWGGA